MKSILVLVSSLLSLTFASKAAVHTVDNNPGSVAQFTSLADAIAAAETDDTILIAGSGSAYGTHDVYKRLHFVGYGFFLDSNSIPGLSTRMSEANFNFKQHNAIGDSSGSSITGMTGDINSDTGAQNIVIDRCYNKGWDWDLKGSAEISSVFHNSNLVMRTASSSVRNCIVWNIILEASNITVTNSVVRSQIVAVPTNSFTNCIITISNGANLDADATYSHCMNIGASLLPDENNNINGEVFLNVVTQTGSSGEDRYWVLKEGSTAAGVGLSGDDLGAFGGADPYVLSGVPGIPRIIRFDVPPTATGLATFTFEIESQAFAE